MQGNGGTLVSMEPRNIMLEKERRKKAKKERKGEEGEKLKTVVTDTFPVGMLQAIASFLDRRGFSKTLSAFSSEALIEVNSLEADALEAIYCKYVKDKSEISTGGGPNLVKDEDSQNKDKVIASEETSKKKRKRVSGGENVISNSNIPSRDSGDAPVVDNSSKPEEKKKKKKKNKPLANGDAVEDTEQNQEKLKFVALGKSELVKEVDTIGSADVPLPLEQAFEEPKHKKRKRDKHSASREHDALQSHEKQPHTKVNDLTNTKRSESISNDFSYENESCHEKEKKKKKKETLDNLTLAEWEDKRLLNLQPNALDKLDVCCDTVNGGKCDSLKSDKAEHKKGKKKKETTKPLVEEPTQSLEDSMCNKKSDKTAKTAVEKQTGGTKNSSVQNGSKQPERLAEVDANDVGEEKDHHGNSITSTKKDSKRVAEPKTANAFRRVNPDEVSFADERLQDNSYWAKGGADSGYGAKAQEVLGQVRGKDFRHEKTKKKRGSYRGGQIDFHSHSIKFNYSDEE